jgi:hypothetical protein
MQPCTFCSLALYPISQPTRCSASHAETATQRWLACNSVNLVTIASDGRIAPLCLLPVLPLPLNRLCAPHRERRRVTSAVHRDHQRPASIAASPPTSSRPKCDPARQALLFHRRREACLFRPPTCPTHVDASCPWSLFGCLQSSVRSVSDLHLPALPRPGPARPVIGLSPQTACDWPVYPFLAVRPACLRPPTCCSALLGAPRR